MRVLLAAGLYPPEVGGPATYVSLLEGELPKHGMEPSVLPFRVVRHLPPGVRHLAYAWKCYRMARHADIVYAQDTVSVGVPAALAALFAHTTFLVRVPGDYAWEQARLRFGVHDELEVFQTKKYGWRVEALRALQRFVVRRAVRVVVPSAFMQRIVSDWTDSKKITIIYSSISLPQTRPVPGLNGFLIVSSGRRVPWKNFDAIKRVAERKPAWHFLLLEDMPREDALSWVQSADVYVLNSTYEGLSHALVEAMQLGTPVIATNVGGNPELIRNGIDGLLIPPKDDEALYAALQKIEQDPQSARARAESARERSREFMAERSIEKLVTLLHTV